MAKKNKRIKGTRNAQSKANSQRELQSIRKSNLAARNKTLKDADQQITGFSKTAEEALAAEQDLAIPVKTHLDGDPRPRPDELAEWNELRIKKGMEDMTAIILLPDEAQTEKPFPGYTHHGWKIYQRTDPGGQPGEIMCEPEEVNIEITEDGDPLHAASIACRDYLRKIQFESPDPTQAEHKHIPRTAKDIQTWISREGVLAPEGFLILLPRSEHEDYYALFNTGKWSIPDLESQLERIGMPHGEHALRQKFMEERMTQLATKDNRDINKAWKIILVKPEKVNVPLPSVMKKNQLDAAVREKMEEHIDDALGSDYLRDKLAEDNLELKTEDDRVWVEPTREAQEAEFIRRFDEAVALAQDADDDPTPERYFALLGHYEEFARWLENDVKLSGSAEHILKIKGLNKLLIDRIDDRLGMLKNKERTEEEEGEYRGWQRLYEAIHKPKPMEPPPPIPHSTYKMGWEGAVDLQDEMIRFWYTPLGHAYGAAFGKTMIEAAEADTEELLRKPGSNDLLWANNLPSIQRAALQSANPMWISPDMQKLIQAAAMHPTFKEEPLRREDVYPNMYGFALFPEPFYILDKNNRWLAFRGVSWTPYGRDGRIAYEAGHDSRIHPEDAGGLLITGYTHRNDPDDIPFMPEMGPEEEPKFRKSDVPIMTLCYVTPWGFDKDNMPMDMTGSGLNDFCRIVQTLWRFARQKVAAPTATRLPRPARRRAERTGLQSDVIVIKLRQRKHKKVTDGEEEKAYELSVRFIVGAATGGFWREQWYPKEKIHRQIWIMPFWKGPEDAPELVKPLRAYELTR